MNPPTGWETGERNRSLTGQLDRWYEEHVDLGKAFDSSTGFNLPNGATRSPDASWVSRERWQALTPEQKGTFGGTLTPPASANRSTKSRNFSKREVGLGNSSMDEVTIGCIFSLCWVAR